jgi:hypothetical protein
MRSSITRVAAVAVPLASLISLTACRGVVATASPGTGGTVTALATSGSAVSTVSAAAPATATATAAASSGAAATPAPGTVAVSMTSPVSENWTADAKVTCAQTAVLYLASADNTEVAGYNHSFAVRVAPYRGPGTYHALVTLTVTGPQGGIASVSGIPAEPVTITSTGGTFTIDQTGNDGKTLDATVTWTCP